jgi:hypothetical protein
MAKMSGAKLLRPLQFEVLPAFYQRWWFLSLCLVAFRSLIGVAFRMRFEYATTQMRRRLATTEPA